MKSSRSLNKLFTDSHDELAILITRTRQLRRLTAAFRKQLDADLAPHCYIGNLDETSLSVFVDSAAWATRLRFQIAHLLPRLRQASPHFAKLEEIRIKILTPRHVPTRSHPMPDGPSMSQDNANGINTLSNSIDDPALQQALQRLAKHAVKK
jgi:hypothetical protein